MATSGTYNFNLDIDEVIQEATEMIGGEQTLGHTPQSARRSLNLMLNDWQNRGILLWKTYTTVVTVSTSLGTYDLSSSTTDALQINLRRDSTDIELQRISFEEYLNIPNKETQGRPSQFFVDRQITPVVKLWPTPENSTDQFISYRIQRIDDVTASNEDPEVPSRFIPCMVSGLAYYIALKKNPERIGILKQQYEQDFKLASDEDRNRASLMLTPARRFY